MSDSKGRFVWYELMTADVDAAGKFYRAVVGWASKDAGMGEPYALMLVGDAQVGGVMAMPQELRATGQPPSWSGYVGVADLDATAARLLQAGGKVLRPGADIPEVGRFAVVADPQGAVFMLFQPLRDEPPPMPARNAPGTIGWHELHAGDEKTAFEFYSTLFGWTKGEAIDMGAMGVYQLFEIDGVPSGGMMTKMAETPAPMWHYYFCVADADAAAGRVREADGKVLMGPHQVSGGSWIVNAVDPQGAAFSLVQPAP